MQPAAKFARGTARSLAEDLTQEAFLRAWRGRRGFREETTMRGWLCAIAANVVRTTCAAASAAAEALTRLRTALADTVVVVGSVPSVAPAAAAPAGQNAPLAPVSSESDAGSTRVPLLAAAGVLVALMAVWGARRLAAPKPA